MTYSTINDAAVISDILSTGDVKIHYAHFAGDIDPATNPEASTILKTTRFGTEKFKEAFGDDAETVMRENISKSHVCIGSIKGGDLEEIFNVMQGENWSPNGEARDVICSSGADHTSMSCGVIVETNDGFYVVSFIGFEKV